MLLLTLSKHSYENETFTKIEVYEKFLFAFCMMPLLLSIVALVFLVYKSVAGIRNRCIQMALTSIFLR